MIEKFEMIKYIYEIPKVMKMTLESNEDTVYRISNAIQNGDYHRIVITGSGSSYNASIISSHLFSLYSKYPIYILEPFELGFLENKIVDNKTIFIAVSRTGKSQRVVNSLKKASLKNALTIAVSGDAESPLAQSAKFLLHTKEGVEIAFPCTKSVLTTIAILMRMALELGEKDDLLIKDRIDALKSLPHIIDNNLENIDKKINQLVSEINSIESVAITGGLSNYGAALDGALRLQETALIATNGYSLDGLLHGAIGALNNKWLVLVLATSTDKEICNELITVTDSLGAKNIIFGNPQAISTFDKANLIMMDFPDDAFLSAVYFLIPLYLLSYRWAVSRGLNPDTPHYLPVLMNVIHPPKKE